MKKLVLFFATIILTYSSSIAQTTVDEGAVIAYVNSDRTQILTVRKDSSPKVLFQSTNSIKLKDLAVLASTKDGKSLLIGGTFLYKRSGGAPDSVLGFVRIDSPFALKNKDGFEYTITNNRKFIGFNGGETPHKILKQIDPSFDVRKILPLGVLSDNEQDWYGTWAKNAAGNEVIFYHGKFDGSTTADSGRAVLVQGGYPQGEFHMTNLAVGKDGMMLAVVVDRLSSDNQQRAMLHRWIPGTQNNGNGIYQMSDLSPQIKGLQPAWNLDSSFGATLRIVRGAALPTAEIGLMLTPGDITFREFRYDGASIGALVDNGRSIPRQALPDSVFFFVGRTVAPAFNNEGETLPVHQRHNNGGDMMFSQTGDSVVFITSSAEEGDYAASPKKSGIWIFDIPAQQTYFVFNDVTKMERQPIFMGYKLKVIPPPPQGYIVLTPDTLKFDTVSIGYSQSRTTMISNPSVNGVSISVGLPSNDNFLVTGAAPDTLVGGASGTLTVLFAPTDKTPQMGEIVITYANDSVKKLILMGMGKDTVTGAVGEEVLGRFDVTVHPNPFSGIAKVDVQYDGTEGLNMYLADVLGRQYTISTSRLWNLRKDAVEQFEINSSALGLVPGNYTLFVKNGERTIARQIVLVREN